jgi:hypothetical protein
MKNTKVFLMGMEDTKYTLVDFDDTLKLCEQCHQAPATEPHPCPFQAEISGKENECTCCLRCEQECWYDS